MPTTIFYSWQSDLPNKTNRGFIEDALEKAITQLNKDVAVYEAERGDGIRLDKDTKNLPGSPAIVQAIFDKISTARVIVPDVTFVGKTEDGKPIPNPNVLIEYGWALRELGHSRIISVMNTAYGEPTAEALPFNMRHLRWPIQYGLPASATAEECTKVKQELTKRLTEQLLAMLRAGLLETSEEAAEGPKYEERLRTWHDESHAGYIKMYVNHPVRQWAVPANQNHYQLSYLLCRPKHSPTLSHGDFLRALRQAHEEVKKRVYTGWSMFCVFDREEIKPYIQPDIVDGEEVDVVETNLMNIEEIGLPDYWRMTRTGYATLIRTYREDKKTILRSREALEPGKWVSPRLIVQELTELTAHAGAMFNIFGGCTGAEFRCTWYGLRNRCIADFNSEILWNRRISKADGRTTSAHADPETLFEKWPALVATLANPITMLFDGMETNEEWVKRIAPEFRKL